MMRDKKVWCELNGPCPACGGLRYCTISTDGEMVLCRRPQGDAGKPVKQRDGTIAHMFVVAALPSSLGSAKPAKFKPAAKKMTPMEIVALLKQHRTSVNPSRLAQLANLLGVSIESLHAFGIGWDGVRHAWSFPMFDGNSEKPCGVRLRSQDGKIKNCVPGSINGLFVATDFEDRCRSVAPEMDCTTDTPLLLLLPEGPTDAAAARTLGFNAIGRTNNASGGEQIVRILMRRPKQEVVLVADNDATHYIKDGPNKGLPYWPGIEGAISIAKKIYGICEPLRFLIPKGAKDIRQWLQNGTTTGDVMAAILGAPIVTQNWLAAADDRLKKKKKAEAA